MVKNATMYLEIVHLFVGVYNACYTQPFDLASYVARVSSTVLSVVTACCLLPAALSL